MEDLCSRRPPEPDQSPPAPGIHRPPDLSYVNERPSARGGPLSQGQIQGVWAECRWPAESGLKLLSLPASPADTPGAGGGNVFAVDAALERTCADFREQVARGEITAAERDLLIDGAILLAVNLEELVQDALLTAESAPAR